MDVIDGDDDAMDLDPPPPVSPRRALPRHEVKISFDDRACPLYSNMAHDRLNKVMSGTDECFVDPWLYEKVLAVMQVLTSARPDAHVGRAVAPCAVRLCDDFAAVVGSGLELKWGPDLDTTIHVLVVADARLGPHAMTTPSSPHREELQRRVHSAVTMVGDTGLRCSPDFWYVCYMGARSRASPGSYVDVCAFERTLYVATMASTDEGNGLWHNPSEWTAADPRTGYRTALGREAHEALDMPRWNIGMQRYFVPEVHAKHIAMRADQALISKVSVDTSLSLHFDLLHMAESMPKDGFFELFATIDMELCAIDEQRWTVRRSHERDLDPHCLGNRLIRKSAHTYLVILDFDDLVWLTLGPTAPDCVFKRCMRNMTVQQEISRAMRHASSVDRITTLFRRLMKSIDFEGKSLADVCSSFVWPR